MSTYAFRAVDVAGVPSRGEVEAETKAQVTEQLRERGLIVLDVSEKNEAFRLEKLFDRFRGIKMRELAVFSRQFATLIASGMPMLRSLYTLEDQTEDERLQEAIAGVRAGRRGRQLARRRDGAPPAGLRPALPRDGPLRRELGPARGGARPGRVPAREDGRPAPPDPLGDDVPGVRLRRGDGDHARRGRSSSSRSSPGCSRTSSPTSPGSPRPAAAADPDHDGRLQLRHRLLVHLDPGLDRRWSSASSSGRRPSGGGSSGTGSSSSLPAHIGDVVRKVAVARWSRTFSGSVASGVPILQSIKLAGKTSGNVLIEQAMDDVYDSVKGGRHDRPPGRAEPRSSRRWSVTWSRWGRRRGQLEQMLTKIADFYEAEVDAKVKALTSLLEPMMIVFVGGDGRVHRHLDVPAAVLACTTRSANAESVEGAAPPCPRGRWTQVRCQFPKHYLGTC